MDDFFKTLRLSSKYGQNVNTIQLLSNDTSKIENGLLFLNYVVFAPIIVSSLKIRLIALKNEFL